MAYPIGDIVSYAYTTVRVAHCMWNISTRKVGGLRFVKIGRLCFSFCVTKQYREFA